MNIHAWKYFLIFGRRMRKSIQIRWIMEFNVWSVFNRRLRILIRRKKFINWNKINYLYIHWFYPFIRSTSLIVLAKTNASVIFPLPRRILTITGQFPLSFDLTIAPAFFLHFIKFSLSFSLSSIETRYSEIYHLRSISIVLFSTIFPTKYIPQFFEYLICFFFKNICSV